MQRQIDLLDEQYNVTITCHPKNQLLQIETGEPLSAALISSTNGKYIIKLGDERVEAEKAVKG